MRRRLFKRLRRGLYSLLSLGQKESLLKLLEGGDPRVFESKYKRSRGALMVTSSDRQLALEVRRHIQDYLERSGMRGAKPADVMPLPVEQGVFATDHRGGLPLRKLLRKLEAAGLLAELIPQANCRQGAKNKL